jgi:hypothetical protein
MTIWARRGRGGRHHSTGSGAQADSAVTPPVQLAAAPAVPLLAAAPVTAPWLAAPVTTGWLAAGPVTVAVQLAAGPGGQAIGCPVRSSMVIPFTGSRRCAQIALTRQWCAA